MRTAIDLPLHGLYVLLTDVFPAPALTREAQGGPGGRHLRALETWLHLRTHPEQLFFETQALMEVLDALFPDSNLVVFFHLQSMNLLVLIVQFSLEVL